MNFKNYFAPTVIMIILLSSCHINGKQIQVSPVTNPTIQPSTEAPAMNTPVSIATLSITDTPIPVAWTVREDSPSLNQIRTLLVDRLGNLWAGGPVGLVHWEVDTGVPTAYETGVHHGYSNVVALTQAPDGAIWVGTFGNGLARFDGTSWRPFTTENGLPGNYIVSQTITSRGDLWLTVENDEYSREGRFGRLNGNTWIAEYGGAFDHIAALRDDVIVSTYNYPYSSGFYPSTVSIYDGQAWNQLAYFPYEYIDAITVAPDGSIWVATMDHLFRIVGRTLHKIKAPWEAEDFVPSVTSIAVAEDGTAWFGFSHASFLEYPCGSPWEPEQEQGVYRYDGTTWTHFTKEDGLVDNKICAVTVDSKGNVWFGSFDKGLSRFDGREWKTYVIP